MVFRSSNPSVKAGLPLVVLVYEDTSGSQAMGQTQRRARRRQAPISLRSQVGRVPGRSGHSLKL